MSTAAPPAIAEVVASNITRYRLRANLSQEELANRLGIKRPRVCALESGRMNPSVKTVAAIARVLDVAPHLFLRPQKN